VGSLSLNVYHQAMKEIPSKIPFVVGRTIILFFSSDFSIIFLL